MPLIPVKISRLRRLTDIWPRLLSLSVRVCSGMGHDYGDGKSDVRRFYASLDLRMESTMAVNICSTKTPQDIDDEGEPATFGENVDILLAPSGEYYMHNGCFLR